MAAATETKPMSFYDELAAASPAYAALQQEKAINAENKISEKVQAQRRQYFVSHSNNKNGMITPSPLPFARHYAKILPKASSLFREKERSFVDIGSAPGGMCRFLCKDLQWSGRAFSLSEKAGGFKMMFRCRDLLKFSRCDMSQPRAWETVLAKLKGKEDEEKECFDFVNLGITLQWQPPKTAHEVSATSIPDEGKGDAVTSELVPLCNAASLEKSDCHNKEASEKSLSEASPPPRNHRLALQETIRNEFLLALKILKQGGSLMITLPTSDHPNTFLYLSYLRKFTKNIRILSIELPAFVDFLESTDVTLDNDSEWSIGNWDDARPVFEENKADFEKIWRRQKEALKKERLGVMSES